MGKVEHGFRIGRELGFPTANLTVSDSHHGQVFQTGVTPGVGHGVHFGHAFLVRQGNGGSVHTGPDPALFVGRARQYVDDLEARVAPAGSRKRHKYH